MPSFQFISIIIKIKSWICEPSLKMNYSKAGCHKKLNKIYNNNKMIQQLIIKPNKWYKMYKMITTIYKRKKNYESNLNMIQTMLYVHVCVYTRKIK